MATDPMLGRAPGLLTEYLDRGFRLVYWTRDPNAKDPNDWKGPHGKESTGWNAQDRVYPIEGYDSSRMNLGTFTGHEIATGKFLADVDLDWAAGLDLAKHILPNTGFAFGRATRPVTHSFYTTPSRVATVVFKDLDGHNFVELRGGDSTHQTMIAPSIHPSGEVIEQKADGDINHVMDLPRAVTNYAIACILFKYLPTGLFHDQRNAVAGFLLRDAELPKDDVLLIGRAVCKEQERDAGDFDHAVDTVLKKLNSDNKRVTGRNHLAKSIGEQGKKVVERILEWVGAEEGSSIPGKSRITKLINLALANAELFRSHDGEFYATVRIGTHKETLALNEKPFRNWLSLEFFKTAKSGVGSGDVASAITTLAGAASASGIIHPVYTRIADIPGTGVFIDLGRDDHLVLAMTSEGWKVEPSIIRFVRRKGMLELPIPTPGRPLMELLPTVINVTEPADLMLIIAWLIGCFRGIKPYPILIIASEHGNAKSSACKRLRDCVDPSEADLSVTPRDVRDVLITALNSFVIGFDNLSSIPQWLSDILCSVATGAGFRTRELTTDKTETIFSAARPIVLNSIVDVARSADLVDRSLIVSLDEITDETRRTEVDMDAVFRAAQPELLGGLADAVVRALRYPVVLERLPRMADFATTIESAAPVLGWEPGEFLKAYSANRDKAVQKILEGDIVFAALEELRNNTGEAEWIGKSEDLLAYITAATDEVQKKRLPRSPKGLIGHLKRINAALRQNDIYITMPNLVRPKDGEKPRREMSIAFGKQRKISWTEPGT